MPPVHLPLRPPRDIFHVYDPRTTKNTELAMKKPEITYAGSHTGVAWRDTGIYHRTVGVGIKPCSDSGLRMSFTSFRTSLPPGLPPCRALVVLDSRYIVARSRGRQRDTRASRRTGVATQGFEKVEHVAVADADGRDPRDGDEARVPNRREPRHRSAEELHVEYEREHHGDEQRVDADEGGGVLKVGQQREGARDRAAPNAKAPPVGVDGGRRRELG
jgi:hypothetical protein